MSGHVPKEKELHDAYQRKEAALERIFEESREIDRRLTEFRKRAVEKALASGESIPWDVLPGRIAGMLEACGFPKPERPAAAPAEVEPELPRHREPVRRIRI